MVAQEKAMVRVTSRKLPEPVVMTTEELTPEELEQWRKRGVIFERNLEWFSTHATELFETYPGKFICVAGGEVFAGDDARDVYAQSAAAHPQESGAEYGRYIRANSKDRHA